jgi:hypothetical protein
VPACPATKFSKNLDMNKYLILFTLFTCINTHIFAQEPGSPDDSDIQLINKTTLDYNVCVQQNALRIFDDYEDIRQVAAHAVESCEDQFEALKEKSEITGKTNFYSGMQRTIKNRAIRKLLPLLMFEKSSRQQTNSEN